MDVLEHGRSRVLDQEADGGLSGVSNPSFVLQNDVDF